MKELILIFAGGGLGSVCRYLVGKWSLSLFPNHFPVGTLAANVLSCLVLGVAVGYLAKSQTLTLGYAFVIIGFCGGFSTFSTFSYETLLLMQNGKWIWAGANIAVSVIACIVLLYFLSKLL